MKLIIEVNEDEFRALKHIDDPDAKFFFTSVSGDGTEEEKVRITMIWAYPDIPRPREGQ